MRRRVRSLYSNITVFLVEKNLQFATWMADAAGQITTFWIFFLWYILWMVWNLVAHGALRFDPYPFAFLLFLSNSVQIMYMPIITLQSNVFNRNVLAILQRLDKQDVQHEQQIEVIRQLAHAILEAVTVMKSTLVETSEDLEEISMHLQVEGRALNNECPGNGDDSQHNDSDNIH